MPILDHQHAFQQCHGKVVGVSSRKSEMNSDSCAEWLTEFCDLAGRDATAECGVQLLAEADNLSAARLLFEDVLC